MGGANTYEARQKFRAYLAKHRSAGVFTEQQEVAWWLLNDVDEMVKLLERIDRAGGLPEGLTAEIKAVLAVHRAR